MKNNNGSKFPCLKKLALAVFAGLAAAWFPAMEAGADTSAEIANDVKSWLQEHGQSVVETDAQHYNTAGRGIYTGGSLSIRTPNYYITPITVNAPDIQVGCGGIDLYFGSFSYLKKEELERFARQVMANAPYFAFKIALDSYMPKLNATLAELQSMAQLLSSTQLDACTTSKFMVNSLYAVNSYDKDGNYVYRQNTIQNTFNAIKMGWNNEKVDETLSDGTTAYVEQWYAKAGKFKAESEKAQKKAQEPALVTVTDINGKTKTKSVESPYKADDKLQKVIAASNVCGKDEGQPDVLASLNNSEKTEFSQKSLICNQQSGETGNQLWLNSEKWLSNLMTQARAQADEDVLTILKTFDGKQDDLMKFVYSTMGFISEVQCNDKQDSDTVKHERTLTLTTLVLGGDYRRLKSKDHVCNNKAVIAESAFDMEETKNIEGPVAKMMTVWGSYCETCKKPDDFGKKNFWQNEKTPIAKMYMPERSSSASSIPHYDEMRNILGDQVFRAVQQHARAKQPTKAAEIAKYCLTAKMVNVYAEELLQINKLVSDSIMHTTELANNTRNYLSAVRRDIIEERYKLLQTYGDPTGGCVFKAGGDPNKVNAENP